MIILPGTYYKAEVMIRASDSEPLISAKLARNIWLGSTQVVKTFTPSNINDHLYTEQGNPLYNVASVGGSIQFVSGLDIVYMKSGVSSRNISGDIRSIDTNYTAGTNTAKYVFVCNFTGATSTAITLTKLSHGYYQTTFTLRISCGENYREWTIAGTANGSFSISYNGTAYVATYVAKPVVGSTSYSVTSQACREQVSRLELAGSSAAYNIGPYTGLYNISGEVTTGMARY